MRYIRIAGSSLNQTPLDFPGNTQRIISAIEEARRQKAQILCLPEMAISGYGCEDAFFYPYTAKRSLEALGEILPACQGITVSVGLPMVYENCIYNVVCLIHDQQVLGFVAKQELPGDGIYYEPRWFKPWKEEVVVDYEWEGNYYPFGDLIFEVDHIRIGLEICEDAWNGIRPAQRHFLNNVDLILNPSASNFAFGKSRVRERLVTEASRSYACTYVYSNLLGNEAGRIIYDGEILIAQSGSLEARNRRFSYADFEVLSAVVDLEANDIPRRKSFNFQPELPDYLVIAEGNYQEESPDDTPEKIAPFESREEEFFLAETLALFDYMRKSYSRGFVLSLSGGADSSCCAVMCAHALHRAKEELGVEAFRKKLAYAQLDPNEPVAKQMLTFVYQATGNSGSATLESARELALGLGATFHNWDVEPLRKKYVELAESAIGRELTWERDDITLQNIQARLRAPGVWMLANQQKGLLITTSNRSEAAVGYATMDGDTAGGLAPMGGIDKASILHWLQWAEEGLDIPALRYVNNLTPMAELRPSQLDQTDEGDLMPYGILDEIEKFAIRDYQDPEEVLRRMQARHPDVPTEKLQFYITRFFRLFAINQWKRERYAPGFHLDDANLDPKTWCRFPILSGGFQEELQKWKPEE